MSPCPPLFIGTRRRFTACCPHDADSNTDHVQNTFSSSRSQSHSFPSSQFTSNQQPAARPESQHNKPSIDSHRPRQPSAPLPPLSSSPLPTRLHHHIIPHPPSPPLRLRTDNPIALSIVPTASTLSHRPLNPAFSLPDLTHRRPFSSPPPLGRIILQRLMLPRRARR